MLDEILYMFGIVAVGFLVNYAFRALPFILFAGKNRKLPAWVEKFGAIISPVIIGALIVYSYSGLTWTTLAPYAAGAAVVALQLWRRNPLVSIIVGTAIYMTFAAVHPASGADIAVVAPTDRFTTSLATHLQRWLKDEGIASDLVAAPNAVRGTADKRLVYWVAPKGTAADLAALDALRRRGGKSVVFFSTSPAMAATMGVKLGAYRKPAPGTFASIRLDRTAPAGSPSAMAQSSVHIFTAAPVPGRSRVIGRWHNRAGQATGDAAVLASAAGWWVTHVFLADGDETAKAQFLGALTGAAVPGRWSAAERAARVARRRAADSAYATAQKPRAGEIRAVWDHSGQGLYPGDWPRTIALLRANGITDLFVNVAGAGFAHYPSDVLPRSGICAQSGDQLALCLAAARGTGVRVHAWLLCFTATRATSARLADFAKRGWRVKNAKGTLTEYLDPGNPAVRAYVLGAVREIVARYPVGGVHLDFIRYYEGMSRKGAGRAFFDQRVKNVSAFAAAAGRTVRQTRRGCLVSAAVLGKYPSCVDAVGQDWASWVDAGFVDYVVPMNYTEDPARYAQYLAQQGSVPARARRIVSGIGVTANESRLTARAVIDQIVAARRAGLAGVAFFDLDYHFANDILPYLRMGVFR